RTVPCSTRSRISSCCPSATCFPKTRCLRCFARPTRAPSCRSRAPREPASSRSRRNCGEWYRVPACPKPAMTEWTGEQRLAYRGLSQVPGIGAARLDSLLECFESPTGVLQAGVKDLTAIVGIGLAAATAIIRLDRAAAGRLFEQVERSGGRILLRGDVLFPALLRAIGEPPNCLFASGRLELLTQPAVAIVGSR